MIDESPSHFTETGKLREVKMCEYAIADLADLILVQGIISCSAIHFIGESKHAMLHYPARLLVNCVAKSCFHGNQYWYKENNPIPKDYKIDDDFISALQDIRTKVNPTQIKFFTPEVDFEKEASSADAELIEQALKNIFDGINCSQSSLDDL